MKITTLPINISDTNLNDLDINITQNAIDQFLLASISEDKNIVRIGVKGGRM